jgi:hypothetical protein
MAFNKYIFTRTLLSRLLSYPIYRNPTQWVEVEASHSTERCEGAAASFSTAHRVPHLQQQSGILPARERDQSDRHNNQSSVAEAVASDVQSESSKLDEVGRTRLMRQLASCEQPSCLLSSEGQTEGNTGDDRYSGVALVLCSLLGT